MPHADWCEADSGHLYYCGTATEMARLRAFAESMRDEFTCDEPADECDPDDCLHHAALAALEKAPMTPLCAAVLEQSFCRLDRGHVGPHQPERRRAP